MRGCSRGACMVALGGHAWLLQGGGGLGACMVAGGHVHGCSGGMHGCPGGACVVALGGVHGCSGGVMHGCSGGMHGCSGGCAWDTTRYGDTINERAVCILLECMLVGKFLFQQSPKRLSIKFRS